VLLKPANADAALRGVREAVKSGRISQERLDQSVRKILAWKHQARFERKENHAARRTIDTIVSNKARANYPKK
jgi:beta-glucosidase-like glycosyl hydrolase